MTLQCSFASLLLVLIGATVGVGAEDLKVAQRVIDITPPLDAQPGGVFSVPDKPRKYTGVRQSAEARCLVMSVGSTSAAIISLDLLAVGSEFVKKVQIEIAQATKIPAAHVRVCATHTHSMPTFKKLRMHGELPVEFMEKTRQKIVAAVALAEKELMPATLEIGKSQAPEANFNRTSKVWKTDREFSKNSTDTQRWLDTTVHVLRFRRPKTAGDIIWYHFSAHPVVYRDDPGAGPDWPGLVNRMIAGKYQAMPSFLQGHCGDVNPGDGTSFLGNPETVSGLIFAAIETALKNARKVDVRDLAVFCMPFELPLDIDRFTKEIASFEADPETTIKSGGWFKNMTFAKDWHAWAKTWDRQRTSYPVTLSVLRLGDVALAFHPGELYSVYGLAIRRDSPFAETVVVGYADDLVGYLPDPRAYEQKEYAAVTVPKILHLPPFTPTAARELSEAVTTLLKKAKQP